MLFNNTEYIKKLKNLPRWKTVSNVHSLDLLSLKYYGSYDFVLELMVYNQARSIFLDKNATVVLPTLENLKLLREQYQ